MEDSVGSYSESSTANLVNTFVITAAPAKHTWKKIFFFNQKFYKWENVEIEPTK